MEKRPRIGIGVLIRHPTRRAVLLGRRKGAHGAGEWSFAGGHLELWESREACAVREAREETGLEVRVVGHVPVVTDDRFPEEGLHFLTHYVVADLADPTAEPETVEPDKCDAWAWFDWNDLPAPLFAGIGVIARGSFDPFSLPRTP